MWTNDVFEKRVLRKGVFLEASKVFVADVLGSRCNDEDRKCNGGLQ